jgi:phospholipid-binding lipoprotein MlaA
MIRRRLAHLAPLLFALALAGCAAQAHPERSPRDPWEPMNRKLFWFNDKVDQYVLEPTAKGWRWATPTFVRTAVGNFFLNLRFPIVTVNDLLQGKPKDAAVDVGRFATNTTLGFLGFGDPATTIGLERHDEDFGQTLGVWGVPAGPYLVIPFLGPSSARDAGGLAVDTALSVTPFFVDGFILFGARVADVVNYRSTVIEQVQEAKQASVDYYTFVRDAYFQHRAALVSDNAGMTKEREEELYYPDTEVKP